MYFTDKLAKKSKQANDFFLHDVKLGRIEIDELWTFIKKNKRKLDSKTIQTLNREIAMHT